MTDNEFEEAKKLWKLIHAERALEQAIESVNFILEKNISRTHCLFEPLAVAIFTLYGRPFSKSRLVGKLDSDFIPENNKPLHESLIAFRNSLFAHTDSTAMKTDEFGPVMQIGFLFNGERWPITDIAPIQLQRGHFQGLLAHFATVHCLINQFKLQSYDVLHSQRPELEGEYVINIYDKNELIWITQEQAKKYSPPEATLLNIILPPI